MTRIALEKDYGIAARSALEIMQCINGKAWGNTATVFRQLESIG